MTQDAKPSQITDRLDGYRQALEEHFCITVTDPNGCILEVNDRFCQVVGYAESELVGPIVRDAQLGTADARDL